MKRIGVVTAPDGSGNQHLNMVFLARAELARHGYEIVSRRKPEECTTDALVIADTSVALRYCQAGLHIVAADRDDITSRLAREVLQHPRCLYYLKYAIYRIPNTYNLCPGPYHAYLCLGSAFTGTTESKIDYAAWRKLILSPWFRQVRQVEVARVETRFIPWAKRAWDLSFIGAVHHEQVGIRWHRNELLRYADRLRAAGLKVHFSSTPTSAKRYLDVMQDSRIVVSPYGWCEWCYRDWEALIAGCFIAKPPVAHVEADGQLPRQPNVFEVKPDWTDLLARVRECLDTGEKRQDLLRETRAWALRKEEGFDYIPRFFKARFDEITHG